MKKYTKRTMMVSLIVCLIAAGTFSACSDNSTEEPVPGVKETAASTATETVVPDDRSQTKDNLPEDLDFGGRTFSVYVPNTYNQVNYISGVEDLAGDVVNDALLARNLSVEERLNITLNCVPQNRIDGENFAQNVSSMLMAGDDTYDLYMGQQYGQTKLITSGGFVNLYDLEYIDFSRPWWWEEYMHELSIGDDVRYFAIGDYFINALRNVRTIFYNKDMYARYYDNSDGLYDIVLDGQWTIDKMAQISRDIYVDLNNDGKTDETDQLGYVTYLTYASVDGFVYGTDIGFSTRSETDGVELTMISDDAVVLAEKLVDFFYQPGSLHQVKDSTAVFMEGNTMFLGEATLSRIEKLRDMTVDFGLIPYPKLDEAQENYRSLVHDGALIGSVNGSSQNLDMVGAVLEALCAETYRSTTPVWYETALKIKYSRDDLTSQMIDLIHDSITTSFIYAYNYAINNIGMVYRDLVTRKSTDYVSAVEKIVRRAQDDLDEMYDLFTENH